MSLFIYGDETGPLRGMDVTVGDLQIIVDRVTGVQYITVVGKGGICRGWIPRGVPWCSAVRRLTSLSKAGTRIPLATSDSDGYVSLQSECSFNSGERAFVEFRLPVTASFEPVRHVLPVECVALVGLLFAVGDDGWNVVAPCDGEIVRVQ